MGIFDFKGTKQLLFFPVCASLISVKAGVMSAEVKKHCVCMGLAMMTHLPSLRTLFSNESLTVCTAEPGSQGRAELF